MWADRHTDMLIAILHTHPRDKAKIMTLKVSVLCTALFEGSNVSM